MYHLKNELVNPEKLKRLIEGSPYYTEGDELFLSEYLSNLYKDNLEQLSSIVSLYSIAFILEKIKDMVYKKPVEDITSINPIEILGQLGNLLDNSKENEKTSDKDIYLIKRYIFEN